MPRRFVTVFLLSSCISFYRLPSQLLAAFTLVELLKRPQLKVPEHYRSPFVALMFYSSPTPLFGCVLRPFDWLFDHVFTISYNPDYLVNIPDLTVATWCREILILFCPIPASPLSLVYEYPLSHCKPNRTPFSRAWNSSNSWLTANPLSFAVISCMNPVRKRFTHKSYFLIDSIPHVLRSPSRLRSWRGSSIFFFRSPLFIPILFLLRPTVPCTSVHMHVNTVTTRTSCSFSSKQSYFSCSTKRPAPIFGFLIWDSAAHPSLDYSLPIQLYVYIQTLMQDRFLYPLFILPNQKSWIFVQSSLSLYDIVSMHCNRIYHTRIDCLSIDQ